MAIAIHTKKQNKITLRATTTTSAAPAQTPVVQATTTTSAAPAQTPVVQATTTTSAAPAQTPVVQATTTTSAAPAQTPELAAAFKHAFVQTASFVSILSSLQLKKDSKLQAFVNEYRIDAVTAIKQLSKKSNDLNNAAAAKELRILSKALIAAVDSDDIETLIPIINYVNATNDDNKTVFITIFAMLQNSGYLPGSKPEEDLKDPDPTEGPSGSGAIVTEPVETPMVANNITIEERFHALKSYMDDLWTTDPHHPEVVFKASYIMTKMCSIAEEIEHKSAADTTVMEHYIWKYICKLSDIVNDINASGDFSNFHRVLPASYTNFMEAKNKDQAIDNMATIRCNNTPDSAPAQGRIELPTDVLNRTMSESKPSKKRSSKPKVPEAVEVNGKYLTDQDLLKVFQDKVTIYKYQGMHRHHVNMLLNYIMNNADGVVTKLVQELKAKTPIKLIQVDFDKYTADVNRFDIVFEIESSTEGKPIVMFYNMEPVFDEEHNKWRNEMCIKPFDECTLTVNKPVKAQTEQKTEKKDSKKSSKPRSKTKKKEEQQPAPQPQAMTATA